MPSRAIAPALEVTTPGLSVSQTENEAAACERARDHLLALQEPDGHWRGLLQTNVSMDAEDLLLREFLRIRNEERARGAAAWIRSQQRADGSWANFDGGPGDLSTTIEAYWGLRVAAISLATST